MNHLARTAVLTASAFFLFLHATTHAQLRVVSWNTAGGPRAGIGDNDQAAWK